MLSSIKDRLWILSSWIEALVSDLDGFVWLSEGAEGLSGFLVDNIVRLKICVGDHVHDRLMQ